MKHINYKLLFLISFVFFLFSCNSNKYKKSDTVEQRIIFQNYTLSYDAEKTSLSVKVSFTCNNPSGISLILRKGSEVTFNGEALEGDFDEKEGYCYKEIFAGELPAKLLFRYQNNEQRIFDNYLKINKFEIKNSSNPIISKNSGIALSYSGPGFSDDEVLICKFFQGDQNGIAIEPRILSSSVIEITPELVRNVPAGKYECQFIRTLTSSDVKSMDRGGWYSSEYISKKVKITITE